VVWQGRAGDRSPYADCARASVAELRRRKALWKLPELWKNQKTVFPTAPWTFGPQFPQRRLLLVLFLKHNFPSTP
jgi:hypothetical protein